MNGWATSVVVETRCVKQVRKGAMFRHLLSHRDGPTTAVVLAEASQITGTREAVRRHVRRIIELLRADGVRICADCQPNGGYWVARDDAEWHRYLSARGTRARFAFVRLGAMRTAANDQRNGQGRLFPRSVGSRAEVGA